MNDAEDRHRKTFETLIDRCRELTERYAKARETGHAGARDSTIAFEFGYLFKDARDSLPADPDSPWGIDAFETAYDAIRSACFSPPEDDRS